MIPNSMVRNWPIRKLFFSLVLSLCVTQVVAQNAGSGSPNGAARQEPCWQQAGVQKSVMLELASIQREAHAQVEGVCSNTSLTPQQKHQQVREIHQQALQKMSGLVTPDQRKTLLECRQEHAGNHTRAGGRGAGGCGGLPVGAQGNPGAESESGSSASENQSSAQN